MAQPIRRIEISKGLTEQGIDELARLKENLSTSRITELFNAILEEGTHSTELLFDGLNVAMTAQKVENIGRMIAILMRLEPSLIARLANAATNAGRASSVSTSSSMIGIWRSLRSAETMRGLRIAIAFLTGLGM